MDYDAADVVMFRKARAEDLDVIADLKLCMFRDAGKNKLLSENSYELIKRTYIKLYNDNAAVHFLIEVKDMAVACAGAFLKSDIPFCFYKNPIYGFIGDVYTVPRYRGRGYAKRLTEEAIGWLKTKEVGMIRLLASEQGRSIYAELGFIPSDEMVLMI